MKATTLKKGKMDNLVCEFLSLAGFAPTSNLVNSEFRFDAVEGIQLKALFAPDDNYHFQLYEMAVSKTDLLKFELQFFPYDEKECGESAREAFDKIKL